ncbi:MAG: phosphotransferase [Bacteroidales bacterium]|nr:phosphotransferase [Bacteroidales bacterium]
MEKLFEKWSGQRSVDMVRMSAHGSNRVYYRIKGSTKQCLAAVNGDVRENEAFFYYSDYFKNKGISVPEVYAVSDDKTMYLLEDLGDTTLYDYLQQKKADNASFDDDTIAIYKRVIDCLLKIQFSGCDIDYSYSYPREAFDSQSIRWDLNYFKYNFLKLAYIPFDEQLLENDFDTLVSYLSRIDSATFLYRDFQSRNIMLSADNDLYFIDYQGGRRGPLHYDLASLLYDAKAEMPIEVREQLLSYYIDNLSQLLPVDAKQFEQEFYLFVLLRIMQAMGAYGYRGLYEGKEHFVKSIAHARSNMQWILKNKTLPVAVPHLDTVWRAIVDSEVLDQKVATFEQSHMLTVSVNSFSFKRGYPIDVSGNGGGFVFDCRALPNPGRYPQYKHVTGKDREVIDFFKNYSEMDEFLNLVFDIVSRSVKRYQERGFTSLQVNFGCTGGQHRSVYCAENMGRYLRDNYNCNVVVRHLEQEK